MLTSVRTALAITGLFALAPLGVLAAGVGQSSAMNAGTHTGGTVNGDPTLVGVETNADATTRTTTTTHGRSSGAADPDAVKGNATSAVDLDSNLSTTPAPLGANNKAELGLGVESRVPGASGR